MYEFSVIIPYYNKMYEIDLELMSLSLQEYDKDSFEVVIVDDGSDVKLDDLIAKYKNSLNIKYLYIQHTGNRAANRNFGITNSDGKRIIMLDSDMVFEGDMLLEFDNATKNNKKCVSLGTRNCLAAYDKNRINSEVIKFKFEIIKSLPSWPDERTINFILEKDYTIKYDGNWQLFFSHCLCLWKEEFLAAGGFDEKFGKNWGAEDVELGYRLFQNGCQLEINSKVVCYHLFHPVKFKSNILSLRKNYSMFLEKHRNWHVELFTKEYQLWAVEVHEITTKIKKREFIVGDLKESDSWEMALPEKVLLVGVEDVNLINSKKVERAFIPECCVLNEKVDNVIGFEPAYPDNYFDVALISEKYNNVNSGLYKRLLKEISRISKKCIVINENTTVDALRADNLKKSAIKDEKFLLFSISNENAWDFERNNFLNLAIAIKNRGIKVGLQHAFDPFKKLDINSGYQWISDDSKVQKIKEMYSCQLNFMSDEIYHFMALDYLPSLPRSIEKKISWVDTPYANSEQFTSAQTSDAQIVFFKRLWELDAYNEIKNKYHLHAGIDSHKIKRIKQSKKNSSNVFTFLCTDHNINQYSNVQALVEVFNKLYKNDKTVQLKIVDTGLHFLSKEVSSLFTSSSLLHIMNSIEQKVFFDQNIYSNTIKEIAKNSANIKIIEKNMSDEEFSQEVADCDCFVHLNSATRVFPLVLESIAFGKKVIVPFDNRYEGYFTSNECFQVEVEKISTIFLESIAWPINFDCQPMFHYCLANKIKKESLEEVLTSIGKNRSMCQISKDISEDFLKKYSWENIAEKVDTILF